jgi:uncharacterized protein (TIGR02246 family)
MRTQFFIAVAAGALIGFAGSRVSSLQTAQSQESKTKPVAKADDLEGLRASAEKFEKFFNAGDAKAIAELFTEDAEAVDEEGNLIEGRDDIEARFRELFEDFPEAQITVELTSLRKLTPEVAVEDGYSAMTRTPDEPGVRSPYTVVHVKRDGKWLMASVRDFPEEATDATAHEQLLALEWLVGQWIDESAEGRVETTCAWSEDGNYLLQDYVVKTRGGAVMQGTQRIAWDPLRHTVRSWAFDQSGAFTEAIWTPLDDGWILKAEGVTPDGQSVSATRLVTMVSNDAYRIDSVNVVVGPELMPDSAVLVVRVPPQAAE